MFGTLIDIDTEGNILIHDKGVSLLPCMWAVYKDRYLGSKSVKWIVAMYDNKSPYRKLPIITREEIVNSKILKKMTCSFKNKKKVIEAIAEYRLLNFDADLNEYRSMVDKSAQVVKVFEDIKVTDKNLKEINDLQVEMGKSAKSRREIRNAIIKEQEDGNKIAGMEGEDFSIFEQEERLK
jgi:hypothetical protein